MQECAVNRGRVSRNMFRFKKETVAYTVVLKSLGSFEYGGTRDTVCRPFSYTVCTHHQQSHMRLLSSLQKM
jgi:hypothetical protein